MGSTHNAEGGVKQKIKEPLSLRESVFANRITGSVINGLKEVTNTKTISYLPFSSVYRCGMMDFNVVLDNNVVIM